MIIRSSTIICILITIVLINVCAILFAPFEYFGQSLVGLDSTLIEFSFLILFLGGYFLTLQTIRPKKMGVVLGSNNSFCNCNFLIATMASIYLLSNLITVITDPYGVFDVASRRNSGSESSLFSKLSTLTQAAPLVGIATLIINKKAGFKFSYPVLFFYILSSMSILLFGGRSPFLFAYVYILILTVMLRLHKLLLVEILAGFFILVLTTFILYLRIIDRGNFDLISTLSYFHLTIESDVSSDLHGLCYMIYLYVVQSIVNLQTAILDGAFGGSADGFFNFFLLTHALNYDLPTPGWYIDGAYYGVFGEVFLDFGTAGLVLYSTAFGALVAYIQKLVFSNFFYVQRQSLLLLVFLATCFFYQLTINFIPGLGISFILVIFIISMQNRFGRSKCFNV